LWLFEVVWREINQQKPVCLLSCQLQHPEKEFRPRTKWPWHSYMHIRTAHPLSSSPYNPVVLYLVNFPGISELRACHSSETGWLITVNSKHLSGSSRMPQDFAEEFLLSTLKSFLKWYHSESKNT
jgi:hypothetical protein